MRSIDIHAHLMPQCLWKTIDAGHTWYGVRHEPGDGLGYTVRQGKRSPVQSPKLRFTPEERLQDMDAQGVDVQVVSIHTPFFGYDLEPAQGRQLARDVNDEIAGMTRQWPQRFAGLANSIGVPVEDALVLATLIFGGILDACPLLKACIAHGGGPACFGMGRLDRGWQVRSEARIHIHKPPSTYQRHLYYDCITNSETALRFLLDQVGADRVVLGSDWPFVRWDPSPVAWVQGLPSLTPQEKEKILWKNLEQLLGL